MIRKLGGAFALQTPVALIVANVCQIHMDTRIKRDAKFAIVTMGVRLDNRAICTRDNVYVERDSQGVDVIVAQLDFLIIHAVNVVIVIWKVRFQLRMPANKFLVIRAANALVRHL